MTNTKIPAVTVNGIFLNFKILNNVRQIKNVYIENCYIRAICKATLVRRCITLNWQGR